MPNNYGLRLVRLGIDTQQEFTVFMHSDCFICKSEGFESLTQIIVTANHHSIIATLNVINSNILRKDEVSLSESAWKELGVKVGDSVNLTHLYPVTSLQYLRSKIHGNSLSAAEFFAIIQDIVAGKYSNIHLSSFVTACANNLKVQEIIDLTRAMAKSGKQISWSYPIVVDKHSIGGLPGNRTTPIVVSIVAAAGLIIPKTSSRAITSPSGTADTMETMTSISLSPKKIRLVIEKEGGCLIWGGALGISPADDLLIRVERVLDLDPEGQMIASVLSKKVAMGITHAVLDVPVGPTVKIRSEQAFLKLKEYFAIVGKAMGIELTVIKSNGTQPIGKGIGPALEAKDILAVLQNNQNVCLSELKNKAILLAGTILEMGKKAQLGKGEYLAKQLLESGAALKKFLAICEEQGGFKEPPSAILTYDIVATHEGQVSDIHNRQLAQVAKLAGAPHDAASGIEFFAVLGTWVKPGDVLYRIHAESKGALAYAVSYARAMPHIVTLRRD
ncbi:thymidine/pyrimidine-nucleoside phosphorylase [Legionella nautarum]|uniref:Putative thymidine phosphorylase n=1 Tax=Legionella nautarum TaxID=45070 RepID=A0A0W0WRV5_9GAMM|nr:thymidine phosphorylase family protein [Legionella nautarum]KTD35057.1 thymidine/pyrimidine-nucleoside phosphorylase [Legionella nautarum]